MKLIALVRKVINKEKPFGTIVDAAIISSKPLLSFYDIILCFYNFRPKKNELFKISLLKLKLEFIGSTEIFIEFLFGFHFLRANELCIVNQSFQNDKNFCQFNYFSNSLFTLGIKVLIPIITIVNILECSSVLNNYFFL